MPRFLKIPLRVIPMVAAFFALCSAAWAQSATSGRIQGTVFDDTGVSVPGALVQLASPALIGGAQQRTTNDDGEYLFVDLPPGVYEVVVNDKRFAPVKKTNIEVAAGRTVKLDFELKVGGEEITIRDKRKVVDVENTSSGSTFTKEMLSRLPTGRTYQDVVTNTAGVNGGGNPNSQGGSSSENTYLLDGVNITDPVTGTFSVNFNFDSIEQIQVITNAFDPEYGQSLGAVISIISESGSNTLSFDTTAFYSNGNFAVKSDSRFASDGAEIAPNTFDQDYESYQVAGNVSGPIVRDRIWFYGSYEYNRSLYTNTGILVPRDYDSQYLFGKITAQPNSQHRFTMSFNTDPTTVDNIDQGDRFTLPEAQGRQAQGGVIGSFKWNWFINPDMNLETTVLGQKSFIEVNGVPCTHDTTLGYNPCEVDEAENTIDYSTPARMGINGAYNSGNWAQYYFDDRFRLAFKSKYTYLQLEDPAGGKHDVKAGIELDSVSQDQVQGYNGNLMFVDYLENAFDPTTLGNYYYANTSGAYEFTASGFHGGLFISDTYKPIQNLSVLIGTRYDRSITKNDADEVILDVSALSPRISASWDPWADERTKIAVGYGRFNDLGTLESGFYLSQRNMGIKYFGGEIIGQSYPDAAYSLGESSTTNDLSAFDTITSPRSDTFNLKVERELIQDVKIFTDFTTDFTRNLYTFDETNLIYDADGYTYIGSSNGDDDYDYRLRTPSIARRDYLQMDVGLMKAESNRWFAQSTYSYVIAKGSVLDGYGAPLSNPSQVELSYGHLPTEYQHQVKAYAGWDIPNDPWTTSVGINGQFFSGNPYSRYYYSPEGVANGGDGYYLLKEPLGTYGRDKPYWFLDFKVQQKFPTPRGDLSVQAIVRNITNNQAPFYASGYYINTQNRYLISGRQDPLTAEVGVRYEY